ncbi:unnamed protein product [Fraxinus pennsylvanica]|uniref:PGG domain-containing protein n=1 Tax=Fraxinus pennsylvanica TaxID=56036 RepID=A0AAD1ZB96_9LAMI|nr:unnamed protein product [Fraxinus pennsylvanica]
MKAVEDGNLEKDLNEALIIGKWEYIERMIGEHPNEVFKARLNKNGDTLLLLAFNEGKNVLIRRMLEKIPPDLLAETDNLGNTALHLAAKVGLVEDAKILVRKDSKLLNCENKDGLLPIQLAARREQANARSMTSYLFKAGKEDENHSKLLKEEAGAGVGSRVMKSLIKAGFYDLALHLLEFNEKLAWEKKDISPLEQMASDPGGFKSGFRSRSWQSLIYSYSWYKIWSALPKVLVQNKDIPALKLKHQHARQLVQSLCSNIKKMDEPQKKLGKILLLGAQNGIEEIVHEILESLPSTITYTDVKKHSIFHVAVMYRHENILKMAHEKNKQRKGTQNPDSRENTLLHLVGSTPLQAGIDTDAGAIFQMQNELQWFKKVSELVTPQELNSENKQKKTPFALFQDQHAAMAAKEKEWMTRMATASSVAGSLVATVAFAAPFQVPGGNGNGGIPNFSNKSSFIVFAISDALALFSSITSVLTFLSIFTSRYGVRDYLRALPHRVIIGLISLLLSFIFLTTAFSSTLFLVFAKENDLILIPIILLSCIPVILYAKLQLPSLLAMIKSTFYPSILHW